MTTILRQVDKTFTFEEQRVEINEIGLDLYNLKLSQSDDIELTDFTVDTATLANGGGSLSYAVEGTAPNEVGKFTFTPADVFSGDYADLSNKPTKLSDFTDDLNYSIPSDLNDLDDVLITNATPNHYLKWDGTKWTNQVLNEIVVQKNLASTTPDLTRTVTTTGITLTYTPPDLSGFATKVTTDDAAPFSPYDGQLWWKSDEGKLKIAYQDVDSLQWVDASPAGIQLSDLTVTEKQAAAQSKLQYDTATGIFEYTPTTAGSGGGIALTDISVVKPNPAASQSGDVTYDNTNGEFTYTPPVIPTKLEDLDVTLTNLSDGHVLKWQTDKWVNAVDNVGAGGTGIALTDLEVVKPNPAASNTPDLTYNNLTGKFTYTPPIIPAAQIQTDWDQQDTTALDYFKNRPTIPAPQVQSDWDATAPSGGLGVILNKPYVPPFAEIADPANNIDSGKVLKWNGTQWAPGTDISGGGTSSAQEHDMWWLSTQSDVELGAPGADRIGYGGGVNDVIGQGSKKLGDFGRVTKEGFAKSGNGMTELNGVFTFPSTGQWRVKSTVHCYGRESGAQAGKFASGISYSSDYSTPTNSTYNTYLECIGQPKCSEQTAANNYTERDTYDSAVASTIGGGSLANIFDGDNATYVDMGVGHADMCYLWLSHAPITDAVKITVGFDGHGAIGFGGADSGIAQDSATLLRVDNGQPYGANGVTGSPTEIIVEDNTTNNNPIYSGLLQTLTFTEYPDVNGTGGWNRGPGNRCHVYYIKVQRLVDNVLTEITYTAPASTPTWTKVNRQWSIMDSAIYPHFNEVSTEYVFNITDTSTQKVRFDINDATTCMQIDWNNEKQSRFFFQKLEGAQGLQGDPGASTTINNNAADRVILGTATADTLNADNGLTYTRQGSNTSGKPLLTVGTVTDGDAYLDVIAGTDGAGDKKIQLRSTETYSYIYCGSDSDFHIEHNRDPAYRTAGAKIRIGAVGDHNAIFELSGESILNHAGNEKIKTTTDGVKITGGIQDKDNQLGTNGQVLTSTGTQLDWVDASTLSTTSTIPAFQSKWRIPL